MAFGVWGLTFYVLRFTFAPLRVNIHIRVSLLAAKPFAIPVKGRCQGRRPARMTMSMVGGVSPFQLSSTLRPLRSSFSLPGLWRFREKGDAKGRGMRLHLIPARPLVWSSGRANSDKFISPMSHVEQSQIAGRPVANRAIGHTRFLSAQGLPLQCLWRSWRPCECAEKI